MRRGCGRTKKKEGDKRHVKSINERTSEENEREKETKKRDRDANENK